jgi:hypothetical protein
MELAGVEVDPSLKESGRDPEKYVYERWIFTTEPTKEYLRRRFPHAYRDRTFSVRWALEDDHESIIPRRGGYWSTNEDTPSDIRELPPE